MGRDIERSWGYQTGTQAYKYDTVTQIPLEETPLVRPKVQPKVQPKTYTIRTALCGLVLCSVALAFVYVSSQITTKQNELKKLNQDLRDTRSTINETEATIAAMVNLEYIQKIAEEELQMSEPLPHQVRYIEMSKDSHTLYDE